MDIFLPLPEGWGGIAGIFGHFFVLSFRYDTNKTYKLFWMFGLFRIFLIKKETPAGQITLKNNMGNPFF